MLRLLDLPDAGGARHARPVVAQLGLLLLCVSGGSIAGLPLSGPIVHRLGARIAVLAGSLTVGVGLTGLGIALLLVSVPLPCQAWRSSGWASGSGTSR